MSLATEPNTGSTWTEAHDRLAAEDARRSRELNEAIAREFPSFAAKHPPEPEPEATMACSDCGSPTKHKSDCPRSTFTKPAAAKPAPSKPAAAKPPPQKRAPRAERSIGEDLRELGLADLLELRTALNAELARRRDEARSQLLALEEITGA